MEGRSFLMKIGMVLLSLALCLGLTGLGGAQEKYPTRGITFIIGLNPGNSTDLFLRSLCSAASKILGQPIIVMNKPGGSHALAMVEIKNAKPDGYTIGLVPSGAMSPQLLHKVPYDFRKDFTFILQCMDYQQGIVVPTDAPWKTIQELIADVKNNPGKIRMGVLGLGEATHLATERLSLKIGVKFNTIPFGDSATALTNLLGGHVETAFTSSTWVPNVEAGQLRLLVVAGAGDRRMARFPNIPALMEIYGIDVPGFGTIGGPKGLPPHVVDTIHKAFKEALKEQDFIKMAEKFLLPIVYRGSEDITEYIHKSFEMQAEVIKKLGLRKE
jgi:tripartite-type tricarboxylate transporter receptor subunit TctC